ncbi:MAG: signal peptidase I [Clostridia bacterium]|nr:signal peptidase I [Clostridia bacterium]
MKPKTKKILKIVLNVIVYALFVLILLLTILIISSKGKGYTPLFGRAFVAVESDSMDGTEKDSFQKGALLKIDILSGEEKSELKVGDIISFYETVNGRRIINSHRIKEVWRKGESVVFITKGDKEGAPVDSRSRNTDDVIGKVVKSTNGLGNLFLFMRTGTGFAVCIVLPCLLLLSYCIYDFVHAVLEQKKAQKESSKERLKEELLKELREEGRIPSETPNETKE